MGIGGVEGAGDGLSVWFPELLLPESEFFDKEAALRSSTEALEDLDDSEPTPESALSMSTTWGQLLAAERAAVFLLHLTAGLPSLSQLSVELLDMALNL